MTDEPVQQSKSQLPNEDYSDKQDEIYFFCGERTSGSPRIHGRALCLNHQSAMDLNTCSDIICIASVPNSIAVKDLLYILTDEMKFIEKIQIVNNDNIYLYIVLLKYKKKKDAFEFYKKNSKTFMSYLFQMASNIYMVEKFILDNDAALNEFGFTKKSDDTNCSICFEILNCSKSCIFTSICNHSFHSVCISEWNYAKCPICRQSQTPEEVPENVCQECYSRVGLWMCILCGHIGCNRYLGTHALNHFYATQHCFALELGTNNVWDYASDNYAHRLVETNNDSKIIEVSQEEEGFNFGGSTRDLNEKINSMSIEFACTLNSELQTSRKYYESIIESLKEEHENEIQYIIKQTEAACHKCTTNLQSQNENNPSNSNNDGKSSKQFNALQKKCKKLQEDLQTQQKLNQMNLKSKEKLSVNMNERITKLQNDIDKKDVRIKELEDEIQNAYLNLSIQDTIKKAESSGNLEDGSKIHVSMPKKNGKKS